MELKVNRRLLNPGERVTLLGIHYMELKDINNRVV